MAPADAATTQLRDGPRSARYADAARGECCEARGIEMSTTYAGGRGKQSSDARAHTPDRGKALRKLRIRRLGGSRDSR